MKPGLPARDPRFLQHSPLRDSLVGQVLEGSGSVRFHLRECIGEGGQGWVFRANWDDPAGHVVIVKVLRPDVVQTEMLGRFEREAEVLRLLSTQKHPNPYIVRFFDHAVARVAGPRGAESLVLPFTVLEFVDGTTLESVLAEHRGRGLSVERARRLLRQVCQALDVVHAQKIVHRDLKPSNILLAMEAGTEIAKITDFGLVKLVDMNALQKTTALAGASLGYAPPEQYERGNKRVSPKTDLFSLAAVLFEMLAGRPAFPFTDGENPLLIVTRILTSPRPTLANAKTTLSSELLGAPELVAALDRELTRALAADPKDRHGSIMEFWSTVDPLLRNATEVHSSPRPRLTPFESTVKLPSHDRMEAAKPDARPSWTTLGKPRTLANVRAAAISRTGAEALALADGLFRWEGNAWVPVPLPNDVAAAALRGVCALPDGTAVVFGEGGLVAKIPRRGPPNVGRVPDRSVTFHGALVEDSGLVTLVGERPHPTTAMRPVPDPVAGVVAQFSGDRLTLMGDSPKVGGLRSVARMASGQLVACGDWGAVVVVELGVIELVGFVCKGHLRAVAPLPGGGALTVGMGGHALALSPKLEARLEPVHTTRDLLACTVTEDGAAWAGSVQARLLRRAPAEASTWTRLPFETDLTTNILALSGNRGRLRVIGDDGTVVEGRPA